MNMSGLPRRIISIVLIISVLIMTSCTGKSREPDQPEKVVNLYNNSWVIDEYMNAVNDYDHVIYEEVYFYWGGRSIGPTEYRYRGIIYLTEDEASRLWEEYEWEQICKPDFEFDQVDIDSIDSEIWYSCGQFEIDNYSTIVSTYTVFDGEHLVFDIHQI